MFLSIQAGRTHGVDLGRIIRDVIYDARMSLKVLALTMGYPDSSHLCRALNAEPYCAVDFWRLLELEESELERIFALALVEKRRLRMAKAELMTAKKEGVA